jgi:DNA-binding GntR family transcriptional regulator
MLQVRRITLVAGDAPIEFVEAHFHPERYQHYNELSTRPVEAPV